MNTSKGQPTLLPIHPVSGVLFEPLSRRAHVLGTGLEVFEIVRTWQEVGKDWERLTRAYHWLTGDQLRAALDFYDKNREVVDARLERERHRRVEEVWDTYPESRPTHR